MNASERSPLLGVLVASLGGSAGLDWYPRQRGALAGRPLGVRSGCQQGRMRGCAHGSLMGACERQRARGLGPGWSGTGGCSEASAERSP